jgi:small subunit ribosomal protein S15
MQAREQGGREGARLSELSANEVEELVVKLAKEGNPPSKIGIIMRDQHAVPDIKRATGKSVRRILEIHSLTPGLPDDLANIIRKAVKLHGHLARNPRDLGCKRALEMTESKIIRLARCYKREGVLPPNWRYDRDRAALLVRA